MATKKLTHDAVDRLVKNGSCSPFFGGQVHDLLNKIDAVIEAVKDAQLTDNTWQEADQVKKELLAALDA